MIVVFTDIDGVLNPDWNKKWKKSCIRLYNKMCKEFYLKPVITSTWRLNYNKKELQEIFNKQGIEVEIFDYTPDLDMTDRGLEIKSWLDNNKVDNWIVLDDKVDDIKPHIDNDKIVKCFGLDGITEKEYKKVCEIVKK